MLLTKKVDVKVTSNMCKYYRDKGYIFNCNDVIVMAEGSSRVLEISASEA